MLELAKEAGVSTTTVSKVLNQLPGVGAQARARIQRLIEQNEYVQHHAARHLCTGQSRLIDLIIMRLEGGYDLGIMRGVGEYPGAYPFRLQRVEFALDVDFYSACRDRRQCWTGLGSGASQNRLDAALRINGVWNARLP